MSVCVWVRSLSLYREGKIETKQGKKYILFRFNCLVATSFLCSLHFRRFSIQQCVSVRHSTFFFFSSISIFPYYYSNIFVFLLVCVRLITVVQYSCSTIPSIDSSRQSSRFLAILVYDFYSAANSFFILISYSVPNGTVAGFVSLLILLTVRGSYCLYVLAVIVCVGVGGWYCMYDVCVCLLPTPIIFDSVFCFLFVCSFRSSCDSIAFIRQLAIQSTFNIAFKFSVDDVIVALTVVDMKNDVAHGKPKSYRRNRTK